MTAPTVSQFTRRIVHMKDLGEWDTGNDNDVAEVYYDALYAIFHATHHNNPALMREWEENNEADQYSEED